MLAVPMVLAGATIALPARAQDSFDPVPKAQRPVPSPAPAPKAAESPDKGTPASTVRPSDVEMQDFGVPPPSTLRPTDQLHGPTPTSLPGGRVVGVRQLAQWLQDSGSSRVLVLHAIGVQTHLPNALPIVPAMQGGSFDDAVQRDYGAYLQQITGGDRGRLLVTYCQGVQCWGSYNAALRAIRLGYRNVHWFRGGLEAWQQAGLPLVNGFPADATKAR